MSEETIHWRKSTEGSGPPVDRAFLAWMGQAREPWCCILRCADGDGHYFTFEGTAEFADMNEATHWAKLPEGPRS
jgi:hypothetical protein